jgi:hypothetical protein
VFLAAFLLSLLLPATPRPQQLQPDPHPDMATA